MRRGHQPIHTAFAKQGGSREREREKQHVGKREFTFREGICLGYYCNREWSWGCDQLG